MSSSTLARRAAVVGEREPKVMTPSTRLVQFCTRGANGWGAIPRSARARDRRRWTASAVPVSSGSFVDKVGPFLPKTQIMQEGCDTAIRNPAAFAPRSWNPLLSGSSPKAVQASGTGRRIKGAHMFNFKGKTVLITGASYGLGASFAAGFAEAGANLILTARSKDLLEQTGEACKKAGAKVLCVTGDVSIEDDVKRVVAAGIKEFGGIDVLVNNAGISDVKGIGAERFPTDSFDNIMAVDLRGAFLYMREVGLHMLLKKSGSIVNICSIMGSGANEMNIIAYTAAKGALRNITQQLGCEWADRGVRVNAVSPGFIITEMTRMALEGMGMDKWIASRTPMRRLGEVNEIVAPVMFLASDMAGYITGHDLLVDGGTNAANGYYQIQPIHHAWNADTAPMAPGAYEGLLPRPEWATPLLPGIPGVHYPLPE